MHSSIRRAWVEVDLGALLRNGASIAAHAGVNIVPMVKADAYGLGAVAVARALEQLNPWGFGVATIAEGEELRRAGIERPIVVFSPLLIGDFDAAVRANLTPTLGRRDDIERWRETGRPWQLAIDTGMSRAGVQWDEIDALRDVIALYPPEAAFTHFHSAERGDETRALQEQRFEQALSRLPVHPPIIHAENGAAVEHRGASKWRLARPGIFLYGVTSGNEPEIRPEPVVSVRARVIDLRTIAAGETVSYGGTYRAPSKRRIATLGIGYADGYRRALSNRASVLLHGRRARVVGVVTMDMTMIDVTEVQCEIGDIATLIGSDGADRIDVTEVAEVGGLSPYEVLTGLRGRLPRRYLGGDE
ncbi:MAG: alanine racemase [Deltaproteobacteria bacterium]